MKLKELVIIVILFSFFVKCKRESNQRDYAFKGKVFGTTYNIKYLNTSTNYQKSIDSLFLLINHSLSNYMPNSDISKINKSEPNIYVDDFFEEVFKKSKKIFKETDGYFDPTVGNLVNLWGFGSENQIHNLTESEVTAQMNFVGFDKVHLQGRKIVKEHPNIYLDFNAIAKGYGIDVIARFFNSKKINSYLIEIGGEIRTRGYKQNKKPWTIQVVNPIDTENTNGFKVINMTNKSMATSGNYRKFRKTKEGKKFVHTINPKTGYAYESNLLSVSVLASLDCADVDAYATSFMAMGLEKAKKVVAKNKDLEVIFLFSDENGKMKEYTNYTHH